MSRWDFLDDLPALDLSSLTPEQAVTMFNKFDDNEKAQILADLENEEGNEERRKRALDIAAKIGQFAIKAGIELVT